ncbi:MAG: WecB/TagA/CpsF family glycosyltransferase [Candidatus Sericytochromatia bacterium]|nr:WecB/TagA/CpsF family glycosyltransferase [Candidatus Sericytochromatia bacterium]
MSLERTFILGLPVDAGSLGDCLQRVRQALAPPRDVAPLHIVTMNAEMSMQAQRDPELADIIRRAGLVTPDGSGVVWAVRRRKGAPRITKVAGIELFQALAGEAANRGWKIYFLGGQPGVAEAAARTLVSRHPGLAVVGVRDGFFKPEDEEQVLADIASRSPDILVVALGVPRQERFIALHQTRLGVPVAMGVGGSFDVLAGRVRRAPAAFQALHLEWLYRLIQEPWRLSRMGSTLPQFVGAVLAEPAIAPSSEAQP